MADADSVDFFTPGLYLEMFDSGLDDAERRIPELLALPGSQRATWWENAHRHREDLPRTLPEFSHLAVLEVDDEFEAPQRPSGAVGSHHFVRTPRPGQGILGARPTIGLLLVLISPKEDAQAQQLRDWADFVHLRHIAEAAVPGYTMMTPYVNASVGGHPRFLHFYEMDSPDPEQTFKTMTPMVAQRLGGTESDAFRRWATTPSLRIMYCNTFRCLGAQSRD